MVTDHSLEGIHNMALDVIASLAQVVHIPIGKHKDYRKQVPGIARSQ